MWLAVIDIMHQQRVDPEELPSGKKVSELDFVVDYFFLVRA